MSKFIADCDSAQVKRRYLVERGFAKVCFSCVCLAFLVLVWLLVDVAYQGLAWLSVDFLTSYASRIPENAGIVAALVGSIYLVGLTALIAIPLGVGAAVYLEELMPRSKFRMLIDANITNLASVPSIVYGILGLTVFVRIMQFDRSLIAGASTLAILILPVIIISSREALKSIPESIRIAALAVGASKWQVTRDHVIPAAFPGILTGTILGISRAIGESAPLIMIGGMSYVRHLPDSVYSTFTALPIQIFNWASRPQDVFHELAAAGIIVLLVLLLTMNATAILLRNHYRRKNSWQHL